MQSMEGAEFVLARERSPPVYCGELITSKGSLRAALATGLQTSVDGVGLAQRNLVPQQHQWVADASNLPSGANYIGAVKVRGNLLAIWLGVPEGDPSLVTPAMHVVAPRPWGTSHRCAPELMLQELPATIGSQPYCRPPHVNVGGLALGSPPFQLRPVCVNLISFSIIETGKLSYWT